MTSAQPSPYDRRFYENLARGSRASAAVILPEVAALFRPHSVLDVGCGDGAWLQEWISLGATEVLGVDGRHVSREALQISPYQFKAVDLRNALDLGCKFDLVQSLEVAEHLEADYSDTFVASLVRHGDVVLFSAAIPGQVGTHHVNLQWPSYWAAKFERHGYEAFDVLRPRVWKNENVDYWYRQNVMLFATGERADELRERHRATMLALDVVHPILLERLLSQYEAPLTRRLVHRLVPQRLRIALENLSN